MNSQKLPQKGRCLSVLSKLPGGPTRVPACPGSQGPTVPKGAEPKLPAPAPVAPAPEPLTASERQCLLQLARHALKCAVTGSGVIPELSAKDFAPKLTRKRACFVTLTKGGQLRGCVGHVLPTKAPLYEAIATTARSAALADPRFEPVTAEEVPDLHIEISVLSEPQPLSYTSPEELLNQLRPHEHGVVLRLGARLATFLPQVWEHLPDRREFLDRLAEKAGGSPEAWRSQEASLAVYHVEAFEED